MLRPLLAGLLVAGLSLTAGWSGTTAQDKKDPPQKEQPKTKPRIAIADPQDAAKDPDLAIQGEYVGQIPNAEGELTKLGAQVIARGLGEFDVKFYAGGLPGDGWMPQRDAKGKLTNAPNSGKAKREGDKVVLYASGNKVAGSIGDGKLNIINPDNAAISGTLKRVERQSKTLGEKPPPGAVVLFAGAGDEKHWNGGKLKVLSDGKFLDVGVKSQEKFGAFKAHIEFRLPWMPNSTGQARGNSGVYIQDRYECQVLDSFGLSGENNECGGIYTQHRPKVNMCLPPMVWQTYDIEFTPAEFTSDGKKTKNARATIYHNGVLIHDNIEFPKETPGGQKEEASPGPLQLQNHSDPVVYRNVWVVPVK